MTVMMMIMVMMRGSMEHSDGDGYYELCWVMVTQNNQDGEEDDNMIMIVMMMMMMKGRLRIIMVR